MGVSRINTLTIPLTKNTLQISDRNIRQATIETTVNLNAPSHFEASGLGPMSDYTAHWFIWSALTRSGFQHPGRSADIRIRIRPELTFPAYTYLTLPLALGFLMATDQLSWGHLLKECFVVGNLHDDGQALPLPKLYMFQQYAHTTTGLSALVAPIPEDNEQDKLRITPVLRNQQAVFRSLKRVNELEPQILRARQYRKNHNLLDPLEKRQEG